MTTTRRPRRGMITVWFAVIGIALVGVFALTLDTARSYFAFHQLQAAADASALAALDIITTDQTAARQHAIDIAAKNYCDGKPVVLLINSNNADLNGDIVLGKYDFKLATFTPTTTSPNAAKVNARRTDSAHGGPIKLIFSAFGTSFSNQTATAIAALPVNGPTLLVLNSSAKKALSGVGTVNLVIKNGDVQVDSSSNSALNLTGNSSIAADHINVVGGTNVSGSNVVTGAASIPDPLAGMIAPAKGADRGTANGAGTYAPGYYKTGINSNGGIVTLTPGGVYYLDGDLNLAGNASLVGNGVTIYLHGTAKLNLAGGGAVTLSAPTSGTYQSISIFQDPADTQGATINGGASLNITGTLYFPAANLTMSGGGTTYGNRVIADTVNLNGNGTIEIDHIDDPGTPTARVLIR